MNSQIDQILGDLKKCPDVLSLEQMRITCHISKRKAAWLLNTGRVPCQKDDKKTCCYKIRKDDIITYITNRECDPAYYRHSYSPSTGKGRAISRDSV